MNSFIRDSISRISRQTSKQLPLEIYCVPKDVRKKKLNELPSSFRRQSYHLVMYVHDYSLTL